MRRRKDREYIELSPIPEVDDRAIHRATRLGVIRTAVNALAYLILAAILWNFGANALVQLGGHRNELDRVVIPAIRIAHPEYHSSGGGCCNRAGLLSLEATLELVLRSPATDPSTLVVRPKIDFFGGFDTFSAPVAQTSLSYLLQGQAISASIERKVLEQLPPSMSASAVVLFNHPIDQAEVATIFGPVFNGALLYDVPQSARTGGGPMPMVNRVGWPSEGMWFPPMFSGETFTGWTASLMSSDDETLRRIGLPSSAVLKEMAGEGASGFVLGSAPVSELLSLLDNPIVQTVMPAAVEFSLPGTDLNG